MNEVHIVLVMDTWENECWIEAVYDSTEKALSKAKEMRENDEEGIYRISVVKSAVL